MPVRSRLHRDPLFAPLVLQDRDLAVLRDLYYFGFATTPALLLSASWAGKGAGLQHFAKRLTHLWRAGYIERFSGRQSSYLRGSEPFIYTIGSGKASAAARTGLRRSDISADRWRQVLSEAAPARDRVRHALSLVGMAARDIERVTHNCTELALKLYAGESSGVRHRVLAAEFLSRFWFEARMRGEAVEDIQPDGVADLSFREPDLRRYRDLTTTNGIVPIKPDCVFTIAERPYVLEAEMGSMSGMRVLLKVRRYARLLERGSQACIVIHCRTAAHADVVRRIVDNVQGGSLGNRIIVSGSAGWRLPL